MRPLAKQGNNAEVTKGKAADEQDEGSLSIGDIFRTILAHWLFILVSIVVCTVVAYFYGRSLTPVYQASGTLRLDSSRAGAFLGGIGGAVTGQSSGLATEIAIIQSDAVAVGTLNMLTDEEFQRFAKAPRSKLAFKADAINLTPQQANLLKAMKTNLQAAELGETQLITVSFRSSDPQLAATVVNDAMAAYMKTSFDNRYNSIDQVKTWLSSELEKLREESIAAQRKLTEFQEQNNILVTGISEDASSNTTLDALKTISGNLTAAKSKRIVTEAQLRAANSGDPQVVAAIFPSSTMSALLGERTNAQAAIDRLTPKFDESWPALVEARGTLREINREFEGELALIKRRVRQDYDTDIATEKLLQAQYDEQLGKAYAINRQEANYSVLLSESKSSRDLYDQLERSLQQAGITAGLESINTMLVDRSRAPLIPVEPKRRVIVGFGFMIGLFVGLATAFLQELITDTVKNEEQVENAAHAPIIALIPHIGVSASDVAAVSAETGVNVSQMLVTYISPRSRAAEAYRNIRNNILLSRADIKTMLITSSIAGEGKSNTIANLAVVLAQNGASVLCIDADLRRPRLNVMFGLENLEGLSNMLLEEDIAEPIRQPLPSIPNLHVLTAGRKVALPAEALGSPRLYALLEKMEKRYDFILIDSAPMLVVSDSVPLSSWVDATYIIVRHNVSPVSALRRVRKMIAHTQTTLSGVIFNDIPLNNASYGGYGVYGGYGGGNGYYE